MIDKPTDYAAAYGAAKPIGKANWRPECPDCGRKMNYEDDRDEDGNLTQNPWFECPYCLTSISTCYDPKRN